MQPSWVQNQPIAHRGLHTPVVDGQGAPENSIAAFQRALEKRYAIECDLRQLADGTVVVFHDKDLRRMTGDPRQVSEVSLSEIKKLKLLGTEHTIPTLQELLEWNQERTPLLLETKNDGNEKFSGSLENAISHLLARSHLVAIQSFHPLSVRRCKEIMTQIPCGLVIGPLTQESSLSLVKRKLLESGALIPWVRPQFLTLEKKMIPRLRFQMLRKLGLPLLAWTIRSGDEARDVIANCDNIIFEGFDPKAC